MDMTDAHQEQKEKADPSSQVPRDDSARLLALDAAERVVVWKNEAGAIRKHTFRRISADDWAGYFSRIHIETDDKSRLIDVNSAAVWLYSQAAVRAEGYQVRGGAKVEELPNWRDRLPLGHRLQAVRLLTSTKPHQGAAPAIIEPEMEIVFIDAKWGEAAEAGKMLEYKALEHRFRIPSAEDSQFYSRETSRTMVVRGSVSGRTIYPVREKVLVKLYDRLIESVDGYSVGGEALAGREEIVRNMDVLHKVAAVGQLFSSSGEEEGEVSE